MSSRASILCPLFLLTAASLAAQLGREPSSAAPPRQLNPKLSLTTPQHEVIQPFRLGTGHQLGLLLFVQRSCPISEYYAKQIATLCEKQYPGRLQCTIVYPTAALTPEEVQTHGTRYRLSVDSATRLLADPNLVLAEATGATVTPEAIVFRADGQILYRGRIDNRFVGWTKRRTVVTEHDLADALQSAFANPSAASLRSTSAVGCWIEKKGTKQ
ncbi:hypothetical protein WDZ92_07090 [Nostoc sp. NIES-2111]